MPVKRKTINLTVAGDTLAATDAETGLAVTDAGFQGEDGAVWLHAEVPDGWGDLSMRIQVAAASGDCDESGLPLAGAIDLPLRRNVTVPGRLCVTLCGVSAQGVRRTAQCESLRITALDCPADPVAQLYPTAFEQLCGVVGHEVVHTITGSGGVKVKKTDDTSYDICVCGTGGDMLASNYAAGLGEGNANAVDHAAYADRAGTVDSAAHAQCADSAAAAETAAPSSPLEAALLSKQPLLAPGGAGADILCGTTVKSLRGDGVTVTSDDSSLTLGIDGGLVYTGAVLYSASGALPGGWQFADGRALSVADYPALFDAIGFRFGMGAVTHVTVTPTCYTDNASIADNIVQRRYDGGIREVGYFASGGTVFAGESFDVTQPGDYTVYCRDATGREAVQYMCVPALSAPFVLNIVSAPVTAALKLTAFAVATGSGTVSLVKMAQGIENAAFFTSGGVTLGTANYTGVTYQDGTTTPSGIYTLYARDTAGNAAVQYYKADASSCLAISLALCFGADTFLLPDLRDTVDERLFPIIRL